MDKNFIYSLVNNITSQRSACELKTVAKQIITSNFSCISFNLYEIHNIRDGSGMNLIGIDSFNPEKEFIKISNDPDLFESLNKQRIIILKSETAITEKLIFPVIEYGSVTHIISIEIEDSTDLTELKHLLNIFNNQLNLINEKDRDFLTGLLNRQAFNHAINSISLLKDPCRPSMNAYTYLAIFDLDHFKSINDTYGHMIGDEVLILISRILQYSFRFTDMKFRYGGEEFIIVLDGLEYEQTMTVLERFRSEVENYKFPVAEKVTISIGFTKIIQSEPYLILDKADKALYYSKNNGRNQTQCFEVLLAESRIENITSGMSKIEIWD